MGSEIKVSKHKEGHAIKWVIRGRGSPRNFGLWLSKEGLPESYSVESTTGDGKSWERTDEFKIDLDPKIDEKAFEFTPPPGAVLILPEPPAAPVAEKVDVPKNVVEILAKTATALRAGHSLAYEVDISFTGPYETTTILKVVAQRPDRFRVEYPENMYVCDGTTCWYYDRKTLKYTKYPSVQMPFDVAERVVGLYLDPKPELFLRRSAEVDVTHDKGIDVIAWVDEGAPSVRHELRIDSKTGYPVQMSTVTERDGDTYGHVRKYSGFNVARLPEAAAFTFTPPAGSSELTAADRDWQGKLLAAGTAAPELKGKDPAGKDIALADFKGKTVLVVFGGATRTEVRWLQAMHDAYSRRGLVVLAVHSKESAPAMRVKFAREKLTFYALNLDEGFLEGPFGVRVIPTIYVVGDDGTITARMIKVDSHGYNERNLRAAIEKALDGK